MRYLKVLVLAVLFFVSMIFFVQNTESLSTPLQLRLGLFNFTWMSQEMPFYLLILLGFMAGVLLSLLYFLVEKIRMSSQLRECRGRASRLDQEVATLRAAQAEAQTYPAPATTTTIVEETTEPNA